MSTDAPPDSPKEDESPESSRDAQPERTSTTLPIPASSKKQAFDDVMTPLTVSELADPGTQKVILYMLNEAKTEVARLEGFVERFHEADKRAAVIQEQLTSEQKTSRSTDIAFGVGTSLGGGLVGAGYFLWSITPPQTSLGWFFFILGIGLITGGSFVKFAKK